MFINKNSFTRNKDFGNSPKISTTNNCGECRQRFNGQIGRNFDEFGCKVQKISEKQKNWSNSNLHRYLCNWFEEVASDCKETHDKEKASRNFNGSIRNKQKKSKEEFWMLWKKSYACRNFKENRQSKNGISKFTWSPIQETNQNKCGGL